MKILLFQTLKLSLNRTIVDLISYASPFDITFNLVTAVSVLYKVLLSVKLSSAYDDLI